MQTQLKMVKSELSKGKSSERVSQAASELQFLLNFNSSITQSMAKTLEHLTDFVFVTVANTTLVSRDSYLSHLKMGIKPDTLAALRTGPLHIATLFSDTVLKQAEQDIANFESTGQIHSGKKGRFHPYERQDKRSDYKKSDRPAWKSITTPRDQPRASSPLNDNYFVNSLQEGLLAGSETLPLKETLNFASFHVVKSVPSAPGHSQKRELSPGAADCQISRNYKLKYVNSVSCVTQLYSVQPVVNAPNVAQNLPVGADFKAFGKLG